MTLKTLRQYLEHAPPATPPPEGLTGWETSLGWVCASCASRVMGRGCRLPEGSLPDWGGNGECVGCSNMISER